MRGYRPITHQEMAGVLCCRHAVRFCDGAERRVDGELDGLNSDRRLKRLILICEEAPMVIVMLYRVVRRSLRNHIAKRR